jgi:hypothetical protein
MMNQKFKRKGKTMYKLKSILNLALSSLHAGSVSRLFRSAFCLVLLATLGMSQATAAVYEPFNYTGSVANGTTATGDGFTGSWTCGAAASVAAGLTYPDLPVANGSLSSTSGRQSVDLATPLSSGTKWISFLFNMTGNNGGNYCGIYFPNGGTGLFVGYGFGAISGAQGKLGMGSINTVGTAPQGAASLASTLTGTYGTTPYLVALKIDFNTSGANDTVTVYINPVANQETPGVAATYTVSTFDVGTITGIGFQNSGGGFPIVADEIRVGDTYGEAISAVTAPPAAPAGLNAMAGTNYVSLSWTAATGIPSSYNVKRASSSGGPYTTIDTVTAPTVTYEEAILGGQTYYYVVSAVNVKGEGADSAYVAVSPILAAPATPAGLSAFATNSLVSLSWTGTDFASGYTVKRAENIAGPYSTIGTTTAPEVTYDDTDVFNATTYYYVVSATGAGGPSSDTSPVSATPTGPMPFVLNIDDGLGIVFFASNNVSYQVQWASEDLGTNTVWYDLTEPFPGNGETNTMFDPVAAPHNYYRVLSIE